MPTNHSHDHSPLAILTEMAVEGTSTLVEAQRALLDLAKQENEIILTGLRAKIGGFQPAIAMTDLVRRSVDTLIDMQQELLSTGSRQTLLWLQSQDAGEGAARFAEFAREGVETFTRAQGKFLHALEQESAKAMSGNREHDAVVAKKELTELAREAGRAFIEAQKRMLDLVGQQMNVSVDLSTRALGLVPSPELAPLANRATSGIRDFMAAEGALIESVLNTKKPAAAAKQGRKRTAKAKA
jgi:hypothetical protein